MKIFLSTLFFSLLVFSNFAQTSWKIDMSNSTITFDYKAEKTNGSFSELTTEIIFDPSDISSSSITATVPVNSISTKNKMRDQHLQSDDFFDAKAFPNITFTSTSFEKTEEGYKVTGDLTIRDIKRQEVISFTFVDNVFKGSFVIDAGIYGVVKKAKKPELVSIQLEVSVTN